MRKGHVVAMGNWKFFINWIELSSSILIMFQMKNERGGWKSTLRKFNHQIALKTAERARARPRVQCTHTGLLCGSSIYTNIRFFFHVVTLSRGIDEGQARQRLKNVPIIGAEFSIWLKTFTKKDKSHSTSSGARKSFKSFFSICFGSASNWLVPDFGCLHNFFLLFFTS